MASQAYFDWVDDGRPWKFSRPVTALGNRLRAHGYTVYFQGNDDHLKKNTPEDHTPFSATGWPGKSPYPYCMAGDIMPATPGQRSKLTGQPLPSLQRLAAQLRKDKIAGYGPAKFLKYLNWEPEGNYTGPCYHDSWQPDYSRRDSTDRGHIHYSGRTDCHLSTATDDYDLVARTLGEDDMPTADEIARAVWSFDPGNNATGDIEGGVPTYRWEKAGDNATVNPAYAVGRSIVAADVAYQLRDRVDSLAIMLGKVLANVTADDSELQAIQAAIGEAQEATVRDVLAGLGGSGQSDEQIADALKAALGDRAQSVGQLLTA